MRENFFGFLIAMISTVSVVGAANAMSCEVDTDTAFRALADSDHAHILLIRHDETDRGTNRRPVDVRAAYGGLNQQCIENHRHLLTGARAERMREALRAKGVQVTRVYHSEACRAEETAFHLAFLPRRSQPRINPQTENAADEWINQLTLAQGETVVLVSHSEVVPPLARSLDPSISSQNLSALKTHMSSTDGHANGPVLRKTENGFRCVAVTNLGE